MLIGAVEIKGPFTPILGKYLGDCANLQLGDLERASYSDEWARHSIIKQIMAAPPLLRELQKR